MSEPSYVKVGVADLEFRKYVQDTLNSEKTALPAGTMAKFELYRITQATSEGDTEETALVGTFTSNKMLKILMWFKYKLIPGRLFRNRNRSTTRLCAR